MSNEPVYVLDANVFIDAARTYYAFDLAPTFWEGLVQKAREGRLLSIDRVKDEIDRGKDELARWAAGDFNRWFASTDDEAVLAEYRSLMRWAVKQPQFNGAAKDEFAEAKNADAWLVAYARARGAIVVTNEKPDLKIRRRIKIPNVCQAFAVAYVDIFQMLRALELRLS